MEKRTPVLLALIWVGFCFAVGASASNSHDPISILGNSDFTVENGVVAGSGTAENPYLIAGWEIDIPEDTRYGIKVENTTAHFIIRGVILRDAGDLQGAAIRLGFVSFATIEDTTIANSINGIEMTSCTDATLRRNVLYVTGQGLRVAGESAEEYRHVIHETNLLNDYPINYLYDEDGETISGLRSNNLYVAASRNLIITENEISDGDGIHLAFVEDSQVTNNKAYRSRPVLTENGISLSNCTGNSIHGNELANNARAGIYLWLCSDNDLTENQLLANDYGVILAASDDNRITGNVLVANPTGIELSAGSSGNEIVGNIITHENTKFGITISRAVANHVEGNAIVECETGVVLASQANNNKVQANTIVGGAYGLSITGSYNEITQNLISQNAQGILFPETYGQQTTRGNTFHDNLLADNNTHVYLNLDSEGNSLFRNVFLGKTTLVVSDHGKNTWTVSGEGNYWEGYDGNDEDGDGIGDAPVLVYPVGAEDTAPLIDSAFARGGLGVLTTLEEALLTLHPQEREELEISALIADEDVKRFVGFRGFPEFLLKDFPGILFDYGEEVPGGLTGTAFTMRTVAFPLDIGFFDGSGMLLGTETMEKDSEERYTIEAQFRFALELPSGTFAQLGIGAGTHLRLPEEG